MAGVPSVGVLSQLRYYTTVLLLRQSVLSLVVYGVPETHGAGVC